MVSPGDPVGCLRLHWIHLISCLKSTFNTTTSAEALSLFVAEKDRVAGKI